MNNVQEEAADSLKEGLETGANALEEAGLGALVLFYVSHLYTSFSCVEAGLLGLLVAGVLLAEAAVLVHLETIRIVLLVLDGVVIALLALRAGQTHLDSLIRCHCLTPPVCLFGSRGFPRPPISGTFAINNSSPHPGQTDIL